MNHIEQYNHCGSFNDDLFVQINEAFRKIRSFEHQICSLNKVTDALCDEFEDYVNGTNSDLSSEEKQLLLDLLTGTIKFALKSDLEDYYTKQDIQDLNYLQAVPDYYITEEELYKILQNYSTSSGVDLSNYYTKNEIDDRLKNSDFVVSSTLLNYYTKSEINDKFNNYYTKEELLDIVELADAGAITNAVTQKISYVSNVSTDEENTYTLGVLKVGDKSYDILGYLSEIKDDEDNPSNPPTEDKTQVLRQDITIYKLSSNNPEVPVGGSYDFSNAIFKSPSGWSEDIPNNISTKLWFSTNTYYSNGTEKGWSTPMEWNSSESVIQPTEPTYTYRVQAYASFELAEGDTPNAPANDLRLFNPNTKKLTKGPISIQKGGSVYLFDIKQNGVSKTLLLKFGETAQVSYYWIDGTLWTYGQVKCVHVGSKALLQAVDSRAASYGSPLYIGDIPYLGSYVGVTRNPNSYADNTTNATAILGTYLSNSDVSIQWYTNSNDLTGTIWVSGCNYLVQDNVVIGQTDWEVPVKQYPNISDILDLAGNNASDFFLEQLNTTTSGLNSDLANLNNQLKNAQNTLDLILANMPDLSDENSQDLTGVNNRISEILAQIQNYGWHYEQLISIVNGSWRKGKESPGTSVDISIIPNSLKTSDIKYQTYPNGYFYYRIYTGDATNRVNSGEIGTYSLMVCQLNGTPMNTRVAYSDSLRCICPVGMFLTLSEDILYCDGSAYATGNVTYTEELFDAIDGRWKIESTFASILEGSYKNAILQASYNEILAEVNEASGLTDGSGFTKISDALLKMVANNITLRVAELESIEDATGELMRKLSSTSISLSPEEIVLTAISGKVSLECQFTIINMDGDSETVYMNVGDRIFVKYYKLNISDGIYEYGIAECVGITSNASGLRGSNAALQLVDIYAKSLTDSTSYYLGYSNKYPNMNFMVDYASLVTKTPGEYEQYAYTSSKETVKKEDVKSSILLMVDDSIRLSVVDGADEENGAYFELKVTTDGSDATINANKIILNGDTIAKAIKAEDLEIRNGKDLVTAIRKDGSVLFANNSNGRSTFNADGSGLLAGGLISWSKVNSEDAFKLTVRGDGEFTGTINAKDGTIGGWVIGDDEIMSTKDEGPKIVMSPEALVGYKDSSTNASWLLNKDGSGKVASNNFYWDTEGNITANNLNVNSGTFNGVINASGGILYPVLTFNDYTHPARNAVIENNVVFAEFKYSLGNGTINCSLPSEPKVGQLIIVTNANRYSDYVNINGNAGRTIFGYNKSTELSDFDLNVGVSVQMIWTGEHWVVTSIT